MIIRVNSSQSNYQEQHFSKPIANHFRANVQRALDFKYLLSYRSFESLPPLSRHDSRQNHTRHTALPILDCMRVVARGRDIKYTASIILVPPNKHHCGHDCGRSSLSRMLRSLSHTYTLYAQSLRCFLFSPTSYTRQ